MEIYAHPASQPSRSVLWFCAINEIDCTIVTDTGLDLSAVNPRQQVPFLKNGDFALNEMPAILTYLAELNELESWWPNNVQTRAKIQSYLHSHHSLARLATLTLMAPHVLTVFDVPPFGPSTSFLSNATIQAALADKNKLAHGQSLMHDVLQIFENHYLAGSSAFIAALDKPSIADIAAYEEIAQLVWANLVNLSDHPKTLHWLDRMSQLPHHTELHRFNTQLGDIARSPIDPAKFFQAIDDGLSGLQEAGLKLRI